MIGKKLKILREINNYSRVEVADAIGVCERTYSKFENDEEYPKHEYIVSIAKFYKIEPKELEYSEPKMVFENNDNTKVENQGNIHTNSKEDRKLIDDMFNLLKEEIISLKEENKILLEKIIKNN